MKETIAINKYVELTYKILDQSNGEIIEQVDEPLGYVHGDNSLLFNEVTRALEGKSVGDQVKTSLDCTQAFGPRLEELTFTDDIDNVPIEFRSIGTSVTMENDKGKTKDFIVTKIENNKLTVDGNHPLAGKDIVFLVEVLSIRDATKEEIIAGGPVSQG
jgi:FKBP-type peptidyl-prolyl cis-trans isomerase SlyD